MLNKTKSIWDCFFARLDPKTDKGAYFLIAIWICIIVGLAALIFYATQPVQPQPVFSVVEPIVISAESSMEKGMQVQVPFAGFGIDFNRLVDLNCTFFVSYKDEPILSKQSIDGTKLFFWLEEGIGAGAIDTYKMNFECD